MRSALMGMVLAASLASVGHAQPSDRNDPYLWLEDAHGERAMSWVNGENAKTLNVLEKDARYPSLYADALKIDEAKDRIPAPRIIDGAVYNFWQDAEHVRGVWRKTTLADYRAAEPHWTTVLDLDTLAKTENANWFIKGENCQQPAQTRCLISLSDGGEDAVTIREFDLPTQSFVKDGFLLPHGKQRRAWETANSVLVSREWAPGELTASGYPFVVKRVVRGQPLSAATEVFRGSAGDGGYGVSPVTLVDGAGHSVSLIDRPLSTFESEKYLVVGDHAVKLALPLKSTPQELIDGRLIVSIDQDWAAGGGAFKQGALVAIDLAALSADPAHLKPTLIYAPGRAHLSPKLPPPRIG